MPVVRNGNVAANVNTSAMQPLMQYPSTSNVTAMSKCRTCSTLTVAVVRDSSPEVKSALRSRQVDGGWH